MRGLCVETGGHVAFIPVSKLRLALLGFLGFGFKAAAAPPHTSVDWREAFIYITGSK